LAETLGELLWEVKSWLSLKNSSLTDCKNLFNYGFYVESIGKVGLQTNQGKNALCSCGSGKKYKRCCGAGCDAVLFA